MCNHSPNREAAMVPVRTDAYGTPTVWCDPCLEPLVAALNTKAFRTVASCCGHGHRPGRIDFADGRTVVLPRDAADVDRIEAAFPTTTHPTTRNQP